MQPSASRSIYFGIFLASLATLIWSGNFIIARGIYKQIDPVSLAFYRWAVATIIIFPFAIKRFNMEWHSIKRSWHYLFWFSLTGISLFNTFVYIAGHYTTAINLALIGTTSSPIMSIILARIFLKERIGWMKISGLIICIAGILFLLSKGNFKNLLTLSFSSGDAWMLVAAFCFAVYNILVRKKPSSISPVNFLFASFFLGTILLLPFFLWEINNTNRLQRRPFHILPLIVLSQFAGTSLWFVGNAILPDMQRELNIQSDQLGNITSVVQFGFIAGTLLFAIFSIADRFSSSKVFFVSCMVAAAGNVSIIWLAKNIATLFVLLFITGFFLAGIYPVGMNIAVDCYEKSLG